MAKEKSLPMAAWDICRMYKEAKDKPAQLKILAELNGTSQSEIRNILIDGGFDVPPIKRGRYAAAAVDAKQEGASVGEGDALAPAADALEDEVAEALPQLPAVETVEDVGRIAPWGRAALLCGLIRDNDSAANKSEILCLAANLFLADACDAYGIPDVKA